ncbi:MAG: hypothetical protein KDI13_07930 [Alphaproteobacteria bacterium]|nr:hypothetical protein [Alphaproteobacteria bacterium]
MADKSFSLRCLLGAVFALFAFVPSYAHADAPKKIGQYGDWAGYVLFEDGKQVCYMVSQPVKAEGKYSSRGDVFILVTHRPAENTRDVFSYIAGYSYKPGSDASVTIDGREYVLFTQGDTAWAPDAAADHKLSQAIMNGSKMVVKGTSTRGTLTTDTYSLKGSTAAHKAISKECGIR